MRGSAGIPVLLNHTQSSSCPSWRPCNQNKVKGKGSARKQIKEASLGTGFLTEKWVRCLTEENPIRVLLAEHFNYPVGKQADMGRYQMVVWHAVGGQVSAAAHSCSPQGSYHCKHTAITMNTSKCRHGKSTLLKLFAARSACVPTHPHSLAMPTFLVFWWEFFLKTILRRYSWCHV